MEDLVSFFFRVLSPYGAVSQELFALTFRTGSLIVT